MLDYFERNRAHLEPWDPIRPDVFYTLAFWRERLEKNREEAATARGLRTFVSLADEIIGTCNYQNFVFGAFCACHLGYSLDAKHVGKGLMRETLELTIPYVHSLGIHRIMANYLPRNERSAKLLKRLGFVIEGRAAEYLKINGAWEEHVLTALTKRPTSPPL